MSTNSSAEGPVGKNLSPSLPRATGAAPRNSTEHLYPAGIPSHLTYPNIAASGLLALAAKHSPDWTAVQYYREEFTYSEIDHAVDALASWFQANDIHSGERVGVLLPNCPEYLIALNAIWRAGGVAVALSPLSVADEIQRLLEQTECKTVVTLDLLSPLLEHSSVDREILVSLDRYLPRWQKSIYAFARWRRTGHLQFPHTQRQTWLWDAIQEFRDLASSSLAPVEILPSRDPAYILSTGGTTGDAKAVTLSHRNIVANAWQQAHWVGGPDLTRQESMLAVLPFFHSYGMSTMLATGPTLSAKLIMLPRFSVEKTIRAIELHRPTIFHAVPAMLSALNRRLRRRRSDLSSIKWVISGGASLPSEVALEFAQHSGALIVEGYGLSEASPVTHVGPLDGSNQLGTIGLPLPDTDCRIVDLQDASKQLSPGEVGELLIKGPQVMLGYWKNQSATDQVLRNGWLHTGDLARQTPQGYFEIVDRKKDLIITSGFNVYPADVEQILREHDDIEDVAVVGVPDLEKGEIVKAFVVLKSGVRWNQSKLERFARARLAKHRQPKLWELRSQLPTNFLGKVIRRELRIEAIHLSDSTPPQLQSPKR